MDELKRHNPKLPIVVCSVFPSSATKKRPADKIKKVNELYAAVVAHVGIFDMLRVERQPNGVFNVTEFGTVKDPAEFAALLEMSTYHQIKDGTGEKAMHPVDLLYEALV